MDFVAPILIVVSGIFAFSVVHDVMRVAPSGHVVINAVFVRINLTFTSYRGPHEWFNRLPFHVGQHVEAHRPLALHHPKNRRFALGARAASPFSFQTAPTRWTACLAALSWLPFVACYEVSLVKFNVLAKLHKRFFLAMPSRIVAPIVCTTSSLRSSSSAMRAIETLRLSR
jgi:hypothetical protein